MQDLTESIEENEDTASTPSSSRKPPTKPWVHQTEATYRKTAEKLVHFSAKTVNSNASAAGIRLAVGDELDLPYVSARTLMNAGIELQVDYADGGAAQAGIIKQIMMSQTDDPFAKDGTSEEKACIKPILEKIHRERFEFGTDTIDIRLRQILIPKENAPGGYVAVTPLTSGSVCHILFDGEKGIVPLHNQKFTDAAKNKIGKTNPFRRIRQGRLGIGGANPQNVGRLTRDMQQPILLADFPEQDTSLRHALSLYHKGLILDFSQFSILRDRPEEWRAFLNSLTDREKNTLTTNMHSRNKETGLLHELCGQIVFEAEKALMHLSAHRNELPEEHLLEVGVNEEFELVSRKVPGVIRGLIDYRLRKTHYKKDKTERDMNWPREIATFIAQAILNIRMIKNGESIVVFPLDSAGRENLESQLEEFFR